jgi:hypothetical protein
MTDNSHNDHTNFNPDSLAPFTEMQVMWFLMVVMFAWMFVMQVSHHRIHKILINIISYLTIK